MRRTILYFAYGSNLHPERLVSRVPSAQAVEIAVLDQHAIIFNKRGRDGSAKLNIRPDGSSQVCGVVYRMNANERTLLDQAEGPAYRVRHVEVIGTESGTHYRALTYMAKRAAQADGLLPFEWYKAYVVDGAVQHGLPADYIRRLDAVRSRPDPNRRRHRMHSGRGPGSD